MTTNKRRRTWLTILLVGTSFLMVRLAFWLLPSIFDPWNSQTIDQLFQLRSTVTRLRPPYDATIVHVGISDRTLLKLKHPYLNRAHYAQVVRNLGELHVAAQIWDFIYLARSNDAEDQAFIEATAHADNVYFGLAFKMSRNQGISGPTASDQYLERTRWDVRVAGETDDFPRGTEPLVTFIDLASVSRGTGFLNLNADRDGVFRRAPLLARYGEAFYPSFSFRAICDYLQVRPRNTLVQSRSIILEGARRPGGTPHNIRIPIDGSGNMIVNYIGPWEHGKWQSMKHYDFADILLASDDQDEMGLLAEELSGKIAVVSQVTTGSSDVGPVPTDNDFPLSGVHANIMHTILTENFLSEFTGLHMLGIEGLLLLAVLTLSLHCSSLAFSLSTLAVLLGYAVIGALLFLFGNVVLNIVRPSLMIGVSIFTVLAYRYIHEEKEREVLQRSFEAYFPPSVIKKIMSNPTLITSAGEKKELTILFSDIKSFTTYSASMSPDQIQRLLSEYFDAMTQIVFKHGGTVDKFIGDGLMVFFGDPDPQPDHAIRCVRAAIEMQRKVGELRPRWETEGKMPIRVRIGVNTGPVVVGNMGSAKRLSYTVLGAEVNLAQRLEANAPVEGILISQRTRELVKDQVVTRERGLIPVKGLDCPVMVYEVPVEAQSI